MEKNPIALAFCLTLIILYLIGAFFAARKDERDKQESHYIPMMGSDEFFKYEVRIKTGSFPGAGRVPFTFIIYVSEGIFKGSWRQWI